MWQYFCKDKGYLSVGLGVSALWEEVATPGIDADATDATLILQT